MRHFWGARPPLAPPQYLGEALGTLQGLEPLLGPNPLGAAPPLAVVALPCVRGPEERGELWARSCWGRAA